MEIIVISILVCIYYILFAVRCICEFDSNKYLAATSHNPISNHHRYFPNLVVYDRIMGE